MPKDIYPESFSSSASAAMDKILTTKLREYAVRLRQNRSEARKLKSMFLAELFNVLTITLGDAPKPDQPFTWEYYDKSGKFHSWSGTPKEYYHQFCKRKNMDPKDSFSLINDPRNAYEKLYTVDRLGNVTGGRDILCKSCLLFCSPKLTRKTSMLLLRPWKTRSSPASRPTRPSSSAAMSASPASATTA